MTFDQCDQMTKYFVSLTYFQQKIFSMSRKRCFVTRNMLTDWILKKIPFIGCSFGRFLVIRNTVFTWETINSTELIFIFAYFRVGEDGGDSNKGGELDLTTCHACQSEESTRSNWRHSTPTKVSIIFFYIT